MKKLYIIFALVLSSVMLCLACGNPNKTIMEVETRYLHLVNSHKTENSYLFGEEIDNLSKTIVVKYNDENLANSILNASGEGDLSLKLKALNLVQANLLKFIFRYYENWNKSFYENLALYDYDQKELNKLFDRIEELDKALKDFNIKKNTFENEMTAVLLNGSKETVVSQFTYEYNKIIEKSLDFVGYFKDLHFKYIFNNKTEISNHNSAQRALDEAYFNLAKFIYYSNVNIFNYSTGENGICDLLEIMENRTSEYVYINSLLVPLKSLGDNISNKLNHTIFNDDFTNKLTNIKYSCDLFSQSLNSYLTLYDHLDQYLLLRVNLQLVNGVTLDSYVKNLSVDEKIAYDNIYNLHKFVLPEFIKTINELVL